MRSVVVGERPSILTPRIDRTGPGRTWRIASRVFRGGNLGDRFCFADGLLEDCPCGNGTTQAGGCVNSTGAGGLLSGSGTGSVASGDVELGASRLVPGQAALLFQGTTALAGGAGVPFGDGLRCVGGSIVRLGVRAADASGSAAWGSSVTSTGAWTPGQTVWIQCWYRDPAGGPCGSGFSLTNGLEVVPRP